MMRAVAVAVCLAGCFSKPPPPNGQLDGGSDGSIAIDAPNLSSCATWGAFSTDLHEVVLPAGVDGITEPTLSNDGTDLIFTTAGIVSEAVRADATVDFQTVNAVQGLPSLITTAWLSPSRLILYYVTNSGDVTAALRSSPTGAFQSPGMFVVLGAQDATLTSNEKTLIYSSTGGLLQRIDYAQSGPLNSTPLNVQPVKALSPSIGDNDRTIVWSQVEPEMPMVSDLWQGALTSNGIDSPHSIGFAPGMYYAGPIVTHDGATLYFTATPSPITKAKLYKTQRPCMD